MSFLKKLVVENFQSHENSEVVFAPGLNVIVGPSDYGKSALVRALRWVFYNEPRGANFISAWARTCRVSVEMEDGTMITRLRDTAGKNQYIVQRPGEPEQVFAKAGSEIPHEVIAASEIQKVQVDENNEIELNFGAQLDGPFLLAENGAVRAKVIGRLGGVHILDWAQKKTITDLRRLRDEEGRLATEISRLEAELERYAHLPELEGGIRQLEERVARIEAITADIAALEELQCQWQDISARLSQLDQLLAGLGHLDGAEDQAGRIEIEAGRYRSLESLAFELAQVERQLGAVAYRLTILAGLDQAESQFVRLEQASAEFARTVQLAEEVARTDALLQRVARITSGTAAVDAAEISGRNAEHLFEQWLELFRIENELAVMMAALQAAAGAIEQTGQLEQIAADLDQAGEVWQRMVVYRELWQNWQDNDWSYQGKILETERCRQELEQKLSDYERLLVQIGRCPVCFNELTLEAVRRALAEYE
jgi:DNA repair ATPase RecN